MKEIIERLDKWVSENRPEYYKDLNTGLSDFEIKAWETKFGFEFPEEFKWLYQWKNRQSNSNREYFFEYQLFDSMEMVYDQWKFGKDELSEDNEEDFIAWGHSWLRFTSMLNSDGFCVDVKGDLGHPGSIVYYIHDDENEMIYPSMKKLFGTIISQFEQRVYGYNTKEDGRRVFEILDAS